MTTYLFDNREIADADVRRVDRAPASCAEDEERWGALADRYQLWSGEVLWTEGNRSWWDYRELRTRSRPVRQVDSLVTGTR